uniref:C-type lectin domain-containing protein n=1 Tax=Setaria digitata TaxID=48799 RepID=A0A915PQ60_9BILA
MVKHLLDEEGFCQMNARLKCAESSAFLASISTKEENTFIRDLLLAENVTLAYIGLQSETYNVSHRYWCDGTPLDYTEWMDEKPDDGDFGMDGCVVIGAENGKWDDWTCEASDEREPRGAVCQIRKSESGAEGKSESEIQEKNTNVNEEGSICLEGFEFCASTNNCYKVVIRKEGMNQTVASTECSKYGAHLVSIDSAEENQFVSDLAMKYPLSAIRVYIGLESDEENQNATERHWVDGTAVSFLNWEYMKPDDEPYSKSNCVVLIPERNGVWDDWACDSCCIMHAVYGAVCEIDHDKITS